MVAIVVKLIVWVNKMIFELLITIILLIIFTLLSQYFLKKKIISTGYNVRFYINEFNSFLRQKKYWHLTIISYSFWIYGIILFYSFDLIKFDVSKSHYLSYVTLALITLNIFMIYNLRKFILFSLPI
jgi:hypothetical protein